MKKAGRKHPDRLVVELNGHCLVMQIQIYIMAFYIKLINQCMLGKDNFDNKVNCTVDLKGDARIVYKVGKTLEVILTSQSMSVYYSK